MRKVILIGGGSASGKTYVLRKVLEKIRPQFNNNPMIMRSLWETGSADRVGFGPTVPLLVHLPFESFL